MKTITLAFALALAVSTLNSLAQSSGGAEPGGGQGRGQGGQHQLQSPAQLAAHLIGKYDANKDGKLSQEELTQAVQELQQNRPQRSRIGQKTAPSADKVAAQMIEKFAADKTGLTQDELANAIAAHRANRDQHGPGQQGAGHSGGPSGSGSNQ